MEVTGTFPQVFPPVSSCLPLPRSMTIESPSPCQSGSFSTENNVLLTPCCRQLLQGGGKLVFSVEKDRDWPGEGDSMVIDLGDGRHDETGETLGERSR